MVHRPKIEIRRRIFGSCLSTRTGLFVRAARFAVTGVFVTLVHIAAAVAFINNVAPLPAFANATAFTIATATSYLINTTWSFSRRPDRGTLFRYLVVSTAGLALTTVISTIAEAIGLHYLAGILAVVLIIPPTTFALHHRWTYGNVGAGHGWR